ncbi:hypothetical protein K458DRAFT_243183, partial [Lentithecium fluviatile CBS 122367]
MSLILALAAVPGMLGTQEAIRQGQQKERREEHRARRCNLVARCIKSSSWSRMINGRPLILRDGAIYIDTCTPDDAIPDHLLAGYFLPYPDSPYEGFVTTITDVAPVMNWVYLHSETNQLRYGVRNDAQPHITGPFDCTRQDRRMTLQGWEGFCTVEVLPGEWGVFFDADDDGLRKKMESGVIAEGTRVLEIELCREEKRWIKDTEGRTADQTINR